jgi:ribosomal protein L11 methyltransferase
MIRLGVRVSRERSELVLAELLELAPGGVEEVDRGDAVEYAIYGPPGELPALPDVRAATGDALVEVFTEAIPDDWADRWRQFHEPLVIDGKLTVRPPWEAAAESPIDVVIDPGRAFGTGAHATTQMCLEMMLSLPARGSFVDLGCGSGILAIAAARLGYEPVLAVDNDPAAIEATRANAATNGAELEVRHLDLRAESVPVARTVAANLLTALLVPCAASLARAELVIASGILTEEAGRVVDAFAAAGLRERDRRLDGDWMALLLQAA